MNWIGSGSIAEPLDEEKEEGVCDDPTETMVRSEKKLPKHQQSGNTYDLMRVTAVILSANQEAEPETGETASVCSLSPFLLNAT